VGVQEQSAKKDNEFGTMKTETKRDYKIIHQLFHESTLQVKQLCSCGKFLKHTKVWLKYLLGDQDVCRTIILKQLLQKQIK
jgi:hypothetical protein